MTFLPGQTLSIPFEDANLIVVEKPSGLLSQSDQTGEDSLVDLLRRHFGRHYVGLVHRLDRPTSGLMVVAKRSKAANRLSASLQSGEIIRKYRAWVFANLPFNEKILSHWLVKDESQNKVSASEIKPETVGSSGKPALTKVKVLERKAGLTLCEFELETGRGHQIRAQMSAIGAPLVGDVKYGGPFLKKGLFLLHSCYLEFPHPIGGKILSFHSDTPSEWKQHFRKLEKP